MVATSVTLVRLEGLCAKSNQTLVSIRGHKNSSVSIRGWWMRNRVRSFCLVFSQSSQSFAKISHMWPNNQYNAMSNSVGRPSDITRLVQLVSQMSIHFKDQLCKMMDAVTPILALHNVGVSVDSEMSPTRARFLYPMLTGLTDWTDHCGLLLSKLKAQQKNTNSNTPVTARKHW